MHFTKMHGCGNDYIYINADTESIPEDKETKERLIRFLSDRHFGIGGDGVILIRRLPKEDGDFEMEMYNADGSRGKMCGNGIRCVGKYVYDHGLTTKTEVVITSCGVPHLLSLHIGADGQVDTATVNMGTPIFTPEQIPLKLPESHLRAEEDVYAGRKTSPVARDPKLRSLFPDAVLSCPIHVDGKEYFFNAVSMGNPHAVVFLDNSIDLAQFPLDVIGPSFESHPYFPERVNTEFVQVLSPSLARMRVYERGSGETLACGTGCCAVTAACVLNGLTNRQLTIEVRGGRLTCTFDEIKNTIFLSGPAKTVFEGDLAFEEEAAASFV